MIKNIIEYFIETVKKNGNKIAVIEGDSIITFTNLNNKSIILAREIINCINTKLIKAVFYLNMISFAFFR